MELTAHVMHQRNTFTQKELEQDSFWGKQEQYTREEVLIVGKEREGNGANHISWL